MNQVDTHRFFFFLLDFFFSRRGDAEGLSELQTQRGQHKVSASARPGGCQTFMLATFKSSPVSVLVLLLLLPAAFLRRRIGIVFGVFHQPDTTAEETGDFSLDSAQTVSTSTTVLHPSHPRVFLLLLSLPLQALLLPLLLLLLLPVRLERRSVHVVAGDAKRCAETIVLLLVGRSQSVGLCHPATSD